MLTPGQDAKLRRFRERWGGAEAGFSMMEMVVVCALLTVVMAISLYFLVSSGSAVGAATARSNNNSQARNVIGAIEATVRYASSVSISADGSTLYVDNSNSHTSYTSLSVPGNGVPKCEEWVSTTSPGVLKELTGTTTATLATTATYQGVSPATGAGKVVFSSNSGYAGLLSVHLLVNETSSPASSSGVDITDTMTAANMSAPITSLLTGQGSPTCPAN
ncbi:MAG TPA: hypothetical protein VG184_11830 [Acidimicrobiales bacterium]|nr:hypothetical protein [Acidimicrobiales bacterium]